MDKALQARFEESERLELNMAALYDLYSRIFPDDSHFWWKLCLEEQAHASLVRSGKRFFFRRGLFPADALDDDIERLRGVNERITAAIARIPANPPSKAEACEFAAGLEQMSGEHHLQQVATGPGATDAQRMVKQLVGDDHDHEKRIRCFAAGCAAD